MKKILVLAAAILLASPFLLKLMPKPVTPERVIQAFRENGMNVSDITISERPMNHAVSETTMMVDGAFVKLAQFADEGKIAMQYEYEKPDAGSVIVETWNLSEQLGAAKPKNKPSTPARNGMWLLVVTHEDKALRNRITGVFDSL
ncbi:MAG TPA: hypothetical protein PKO36_18445 [Candidatus Hydrogenedentes bacterium]|nr:hypothetical protein [Candidatus Hydrogenedentota bacterium]HOV74534.1 hypothetical protein [Candidatus Hydrogenedentota bacterium]